MIYHPEREMGTEAQLAQPVRTAAEDLAALRERLAAYVAELRERRFTYASVEAATCAARIAEEIRERFLR